jgi:hypothetical protein
VQGRLVAGRGGLLGRGLIVAAPCTASAEDALHLLEKIIDQVLLAEGHRWDKRERRKHGRNCHKRGGPTHATPSPFHRHASLPHWKFEVSLPFRCSPRPVNAVGAMPTGPSGKSN